MSGTVTNWLTQAKQGDATAVNQLWEYCSPEMLRVTAPRCRNLRGCDENDIVSIAFFNLTTAMAEDSDEGITNRKEFWRLLKVITKRRLNDSLRRENAKRRGGEFRVISLENVPQDSIPGGLASEDSSQQPLDDGSLLTMLYQLAKKMHRDEFAKIIEYKVAGLTNNEVARKLGLSLRTTQYLIQEIKQAWAESFAD